MLLRCDFPVHPSAFLAVQTEETDEAEDGKPEEPKESEETVEAVLGGAP